METNKEMKRSISSIAIVSSVLVVLAFLIVLGVETMMPGAGTIVLQKLSIVSHMLGSLLSVFTVLCFSVLVLESGLTWTGENLCL